MPVPPIGAQMIIFGKKYNLETDADVVFGALAKAGYAAVEASMKDPAVLKQKLAAHGLTVLHVRDGHARLRVDLDREIRSQAIVRTPFADGADQIGLGGLLGHGARILQRRRTLVNP